MLSEHSRTLLTRELNQLESYLREREADIQRYEGLASQCREIIRGLRDKISKIHVDLEAK